MAKFMTAALQAHHCHGNFPRVVAFAPIFIGGLGLTHLYFEQSIHQVRLFIGLSRVTSELLTLFHIGLDYFRLHAGRESCPFSQPTDLPYLNRDWFSSILAALTTTHTSFNTTNPEYFKPKCRNDRCLMDVFLDAKIPPKQLQACNRCRLYIQAITISDITEPTGTRIERAFARCEQIIPSKLRWPYQMAPSKKDLKIWKRVLLRTLAGSDRFWSLKIPLGKWYDDITRHHRQWDAWISPCFTTAYRKRGTQWYSHDITTIQHRNATLSQHSSPIDQLPTKLIPTRQHPADRLIVTF